MLHFLHTFTTIRYFIVAIGLFCVSVSANAQSYSSLHTDSPFLSPDYKRRLNHKLGPAAPAPVVQAPNNLANEISLIGVLEIGGKTYFTLRDNTVEGLNKTFMLPIGGDAPRFKLASYDAEQQSVTINAGGMLASLKMSPPTFGEVAASSVQQPPNTTASRVNLPSPTPTRISPRRVIRRGGTPQETPTSQPQSIPATGASTGVGTPNGNAPQTAQQQLPAPQVPEFSLGGNRININTPSSGQASPAVYGNGADANSPTASPRVDTTSTTDSEGNNRTIINPRVVRRRFTPAE